MRQELKPGAARQRRNCEDVPDVGLEDATVAVQLVVHQPGRQDLCRLQAGPRVVSDDLGEVAGLTKEMVVMLVRQTLKAQPWEGEARSTCRITPGCFRGTSMAQVST